MIKLIKFVAALLLIGSVTIAFAGPVASYGNLQIAFSSTYNSMTLCSQSGSPIQLRGMSSMGLQWYPVGAVAVTKLANDWGASVIRAAMYVGEGGYIGNEATMKNKVKTIVDAAIAADIYVIIDWHILSDGSPKTNYSAAVTFFTEMSATYGGYKNVIWEICNEPNGSSVTWQEIKDYAVGWSGNTGIINIIKNNDPDANRNIIIVGTPNWSQKLWTVQNLTTDNRIDTALYPNIMYAFHFYASSSYHVFMNSPEWSGLPELNLAEGADGIGNAADTVLSLGGMAAFVTEWGVCEETGSGTFDVAKADYYVNWMATRNISWTNWSLCNKGETASALTGAGSSETGWNDATDLSASGIYVKAKVLAGGTPSTPGPTAEPTAVPTVAPTAGPTSAPTSVPTAGPTAAPGTCTCPFGCSSTVVIASPFTYTGAGEFCFEAQSMGENINSWNMDIVNINGTAFTNTWASSFPAPINGKYYIYYKATNTAGHFEMNGGATTAAPTDVPTAAPTSVPTAAPTSVPTAAPTVAPTAAPTVAPTSAPGTNLALNKTATCSTSQSSYGASLGNDGNTGTRWCASSNKLNEWWKVDLGAAYSITNTTVTWEASGVVYKYKVEVSSDNSAWSIVADKTANTSTAQTQTDTFTAVSKRYVRITVTGLPSGKWASLFELQVK